MTLYRIKNTNQDQPPPKAPVHDDGTPYRWEMIHDGGSQRAYTDSTAELLDCLIPKYSQLDPQAAAAARLRYVVDTQVRLQAALASPELLEQCTDHDKALLLGSRDTPPSPATWSAPVPLVLVTSFYQPTGPRPRPKPVDGGDLVWLDPTADLDLLASLHHAGIVQVAVHEQPGHAASSGRGNA